MSSSRPIATVDVEIAFLIAAYWTKTPNNVLIEANKNGSKIRSRGRLGRDEELDRSSAAELIEGEKGDAIVEGGYGQDTLIGGGGNGGYDCRRNEKPVNPIIPEEDLPDFPC